MNIKKDLINSIAESIATYEGNIDKFGIDRNRLDLHVEKWLNQFNLDVNEELIFLTEIDHLFNTMFITKNDILTYLSNLTTSQNLTGSNPYNFWKQTHILNIQKNGYSQKSMVSMFNDILINHNVITCTEIENCKSFIYLDDIICTGKRMQTDLQNWILNNAPDICDIYIIAIGLYTSHWQSELALKEFIQKYNKKIQLHFFYIKKLENRKAYRNSSDVLWPTSNYDDLLPTNFCPRVAAGIQNSTFLSEAGRQLLEYIFTLSGIEILKRCRRINNFAKPLGYHSFMPGFGAMIFTYRNCPNNVPLAIWWGDPTQSDNPAMSWYPLLPRITYDL